METLSGFGSGYVTLRKRKLPIVWVGQWAEHVASNHIANPKSHPLLHVRIQQLAKTALKWEKRGSKRYVAYVSDGLNGSLFTIAIDVYRKFVSIVTAYKS